MRDRSGAVAMPMVNVGYVRVGMCGREVHVGMAVLVDQLLVGVVVMVVVVAVPVVVLDRRVLVAVLVILSHEEIDAETHRSNRRHLGGADRLTEDDHGGSDTEQGRSAEVGGLMSFLPIIGPLDDVIVVALAFRYAARRVPRSVLLEAWPADERILKRLLGDRA